ncbi:hypothetical protein [Candidatus Neptunochlamydia vexilliferae]|uniref:Permease n=1 Tax=Candidatus Neptunichlamydia vexilliferae TaxID=1651774 RepID=A0ABS0B0W4_9BACT|nr:hypothetical protein [Candidatus Neptunochlamydia vexilliferae]MBF5060038.1 hypothetical protein [Candidatus Neptunochlamydia vexilliferae]
MENKTIIQATTGALVGGAVGFAGAIAMNVIIAIQLIALSLILPPVLAFSKLAGKRSAVAAAMPDVSGLVVIVKISYLAFPILGASFGAAIGVGIGKGVNWLFPTEASQIKQEKPHS